MDLDEARTFLRDNHHAVVATYRGDGRPQLSPIVLGVDADEVVFSTRETAFKVANIRRDDRVSVCVFPDQFYGPWVQVDGRARVVSLPEAMDGLIAYYRDLQGEHPDWDEYRNAMERERRVLVRVTPERAGPDRSG